MPSTAMASKRGYSFQYVSGKTNKSERFLTNEVFIIKK
jgi:hypothetical protein